MNRVETLLIKCSQSEWVSSFSYYPKERIFNCLLVEDYDNQLFVISFTNTLMNVNDHCLNDYNNLLCILKGAC